MFLVFVHQVIIPSIGHHSGKHVVEIDTHCFGRLSDHVLILEEYSSPQFGIAEPGIFLKLSVDAMVKQNEFDFASFFLPHMHVTRVRIPVDETFFKYHVVESL